MAYAQAASGAGASGDAGTSSAADTSGAPASGASDTTTIGTDTSASHAQTPSNAARPDPASDNAPPAASLGSDNAAAAASASDNKKGSGSTGSTQTQGAQTMSSSGYTNNGQPSPVPYAAQDPRPSVQGNNGSLTYSYPFTLPKGINGGTPDLALQYDNNKREEGSQVGFGWTVTMPKISRLNKTGIENMYTDNFFSSTFDDELVAIGTSGATTTYAARSDDGSFRRYQRGPTGWTMTTKEGLVYTFGTLDEAQDVQSAGNVATWYLSSITDTHGITISYRYVKDNGVVYPLKIDYAQEGGAPGYEVRLSRLRHGPTLSRRIRMDLCKRPLSASHKSISMSVRHCATHISWRTLLGLMAYARCLSALRIKVSTNLVIPPRFRQPPSLTTAR